MLPKDYPRFMGIIEQPTDYLVVHNVCTDERHMLGDWCGILDIRIRVSESGRVLERALNSGLIARMVKNPDNSEGVIEILRAKLSKQTKAKRINDSAPFGVREVRVVGKCADV